MKLLVIGAVIIGGMVNHVAAQSVVTMESASGAQFPAYSLGTAVPALVVSNPGRWGLRPPVGRNGDRGFGESGYAYDPYFYPENYDAFPSLPSIVVATPVTQQADKPQQPAPEQAPAPVRSEMREYHWPSASSGSTGTYSIVSKDGRVQSAAAVWVQGNALCYVTPDDKAGRMPVDSIDAQATRRRNGQQQLLWLPPESQTDSPLAADGQ